MEDTKLIIEDTVGPGDPNIATTDENLSLDTIFQQALMPSLGRQIFSVQKIHGPTGGIFNIRRKGTSNDFELVRSNVEVYPSEKISTGVTQEALYDLLNVYGKDGYYIVAKLLRGLANEQENTKTLAFLDAQAKDYGALALSNSLDPEANLFEITQRVHEIILKMNGKNQRTYESFAVIPYIPLGGLMGLSQYVGADDKDERGLFIAKVGQTKFYLNPDSTSTTAYVGLRDPDNPSKSSAIFSPYTSQIKEAIHPDTGALTYHIYNRFAITASPLHVTDDEMLYKFEITI